MNILVLNCGSSSLKFQIISTNGIAIQNNTDKVLAKGLIEKVGSTEAIVSFKSLKDSAVPNNTNNYSETKSLSDHKDALHLLIEWLTMPTTDIDGISSLKDIDAIGHRTVHGSETFKSSILINDAVIQELENNTDLAPLHNPANLKGIEASYEVFGKDVPQVGVFDTAFHSTMSEYAYMYGLDYDLAKKHRIRKYGFHGTSHRYMGIRYRALSGKSIADTNIISLHLGNGCSIAAIKEGKCIDTTMGFTPLEGLIMGTRCGNIDPTIIEYIMHKEEKTLDEVYNILNKKSGILGISGISNDMRDIEKGIANKNKRAILAQDMFVYRIKKYVGAYLSAMNGADALIFTGGIGENDAVVRSKVCSKMDYAGLILDENLNNNFKRGVECKISKDNLKINVYIIPTNEELMIARDTYCIVSGKEILE
jgi:acetate kinase